MPSVLHFARTCCRASSLDVARFFDSTCCAICLLPLCLHQNEKAPGAERTRARGNVAYGHREHSAVGCRRESRSSRPRSSPRYADAFRAAPELCEVAEIGGATCWRSAGSPSGSSTASSGLDSTEPLDEIAAFYGETPWWVSDSHGLGPELEERGFTRDYGWMKFSRGVGPREARSDSRVVQVGPERAGDFAAVVAGGFEMPDGPSRSPRTSSAGPGWSCYVAYDGEAPAGAGALFVHERRRLARVRRDAAGRSAAAARRARSSPPGSRTPAGRAARR